MTFAFTSFTPINPPAPSPTIERSRPTYGTSHSQPGTPGNVSPTHTYSPLAQPGGTQGQSHQNVAGGHKRTRTFSNPGLAPVKPSLTAQQIYDLAMSSTSPSTPAGGAGSELAALGATTGSYPASPVHTTGSLYRTNSRPTTPGLTGGVSGTGDRTSPAVFRPMPDEVYLPFIDRPSEVTTLLSEHPTSRLWHLLEALFPVDQRHHSRPSSRAAMYRPDEIQNEDDVDPADWSFDHLAAHLMKTTRAEMDDKSWTDAARACIRGRSEALWERFKGALGVPAELEFDADDEVDDEAHESHIPMDDGVSDGVVSPPSGIISPVPSLPLTFSQVNLASAAADLGPGFPLREAILEPVFADQSDSDIDEDEEAEKMDGVEGVEGKTEGFGKTHFSNMSSGALSEGGWSSGRLMENIGEGPEEEEEEPENRGIEENATNSGSDRQGRPTTPHTQAEFEDYGLGDAAYQSAAQREIRALTLTTAPAITTIASPNYMAETIQLPPVPHLTPLGDHVASPLDMTPPSELPAPTKAPSTPASTAAAPSQNAEAPLQSPTSTGTSSPPQGTGAITPKVILRRPSESIAQSSSASKTPLSPNAGASGVVGAAGSTGYRGFGGYGLAPTNRPYHPALSERGPGNPLFPSSFAGLSVGPTLVANVPKSARSSSMSHGSHYPSSLSPSLRTSNATTSVKQGPPSIDSNTSGKDLSSGLRRYATTGADSKRAMRTSTWADVRDRYEYAVTLASASSDGGRG